MSSTDAQLTEELESLRLLRATLEGFKQFLRAVDTDTAVTTPANYAAVTNLAARWESVFAQTAPQAQGGSKKGRRGGHISD